MKYGFVIEGGTVGELVELASEAEHAGWDGVFVADALSIETPKFRAFPWFDPWVALAGMAAHTKQVKLGTFITPPSRRRPWKLAREVATLDHLSNGRAILAVGLGAAEDDGGFYKVGEAMDLKVRGQMLDESLAIIAGLWTGEPFSHEGEHYRVQQMTMLPPPVQRPRVPVWVVGVWSKEKSLARALRWDGIIPQKYRPAPTEMALSSDEVLAVKKCVDRRRDSTAPFEIITGGSTPAKSRKRALEIVRPFIEAGATWWMEHVWSDQKKVRARIQQGPPREQ